MTLLRFNHNMIINDDYIISIAISDDGYGDYSIMTLVESSTRKRLFNRLIVEDYEDGEIVSI